MSHRLKKRVKGFFVAILTVLINSRGRFFRISQIRLFRQNMENYFLAATDIQYEIFPLETELIKNILNKIISHDMA